jgi:tetratricopeptide (TPR) repeat protein
MIRGLTVLTLAWLASAPALAGPAWLMAEKPACPPSASCITALLAQSQPPAPISVKPESTAPGICVSHVMGGLKIEEAPICEAFIDSGRGSRRERATALVNLGHWYRAQPDQFQKPVKAVAAWDKAIAEDPGFAEPHAAKGDLAAFDDRQAEADELYSRALALDPRHWRAVMRKARIIGKQGRMEDAVAMARRAVDAAPEVGVAHQLYGGLLEEAGDDEGALAEYRKAADLYHGEFRRLPGLMQEPSPWATLAGLETRMGRFERALEAINHEIDGKAEHNIGAEIFLQRAEINEKAGRANNAADDYEKAIALFGPGFVLSEEFRARVAVLRVSGGNSEAARDNFRDLIRSGKLQSILRVQVFLNNQGFDDVPIDGKATAALERALDRCLADADCTVNMGRSI